MADDGALARRMGRETGVRFEEIARQAVRRLPLSDWDADFLASLTATGAESGELELSDKQLLVVMRFEDRLALRRLLDQLRGDPRLSAWEEGFLSSLTRRQSELSEKQRHVLM